MFWNNKTKFSDLGFFKLREVLVGFSCSQDQLNYEPKDLQGS